MGAGVFTTSPTQGFEWSALLAFGTVVGDDEDVESSRVLEAAGPGAAVAYHALYEQNSPGAAGVAGLEPNGSRRSKRCRSNLATCRSIAATLTALNDIDRLVMTGGLAAAISQSGTASADARPGGSGRRGGHHRVRVPTSRARSGREIESFARAVLTGG